MSGVWITVSDNADGAAARLPVGPQIEAATAFRAAGREEKTMAGWGPIAVSADGAILPEKRAIDARSSDIQRNNGFAAGIHRTNLDNIVGPMGLRVAPRPDWKALGRSEAWAEDWTDHVTREFNSWAQDPLQCDAAGLLDFADHQTITFLNCAIYGDGITLPVWRPEQRRRWNMRLQGVQPSRLRNPMSQRDQPNFRGGIETDAYGEPTRYHFANRNPDDGPAIGDWSLNYTTEAVDARTEWGRRRVVHAIERTEFGQTRGIGALTAVLAQFKTLNVFLDQVLQQQIVANLFGLFIETEVPDLLALFKNNEEFSTAMAGRKPPKLNGGGHVLQLRPGESIKTASPQIQGVQLEQFILAYMRELCAGTGLPYELLTRDFSKSSYVGIRAGLSEAVRTFTSRRIWFADTYCRPIYELWFEEAVNAGRIEAPGYYQNSHAYLGCKWLGARLSFTDRLKETTASVTAIENNLTTAEEEISLFLGEHWKDVYDQRAREVAYATEKGLPTTTGPAAIAAAGAPAADPAADPNATPPAPPNAPGKP